MKTTIVYKRKVLERTGFKKYPFKEVNQISVFYGDKESKNHYEDINNKRLRIPFEVVLKTRKKSVLENFIGRLGNSEGDKFLKEQLQAILGGKKL